MEHLKHKKIPFLLTFFSTLMLVFGLMTKDYDSLYYRKKKYDAPLDWYEVSLFGLDIDYKSYMLFFILILGMGIYLLVFSKDERIKLAIKTAKFDFLKSSKNKNSESKKEFKRLENHKKISNSTVKIVEIITLFALFFTFYIATSKQYSFWFFIIISFFYYLILNPKTKKEIILKSIFYPFIFLVIFTLSGSRDAYDWSSNLYFLSKHIIPFLISVIIIFFTQQYKLKNQASFNFSNPLFWISLLCLIAAVLNMLVV